MMIWQLAKGNKCYYALNNLIKSKNISRSAKLNIYRTIRPIVMYASETWRLRKLEAKMITWESKILRIFGPKKEVIVAKIRSRRNAWTGQLIRMDQG
jgi:hypothetical protein